MTSVPTLTTTFTPSPSCLSDYYIWKQDDGWNFNSLGPQPTPACLPSGWDSASTAYFSPGICPSGYSAACSTVVHIHTVSETRATCCPSGYACQSATDWPWYTDHPCTYAAANTETWKYTSTTSGGWYTGTTRARRDANAYGISIRWQAGDTIAPTAISSGYDADFFSENGYTFCSLIV
ncbi:hypothetical protein AJ79_08509 [Helicocarpus griseus UAMH5409]|uniref:Uncharacterized protein n=1 Tax=Helicocarpus griseus UAMH5409 TaxID=1447875 RepID=A0A2B7WSR2_9EURO|nr:hypothetical protein AJ79_08509 [Helicocarpus griseus UAMH5409]